MPYVITTTEGREAYERRRAADPGAFRNQGVTRRAVATLKEAQVYAMREVLALMDSGAYDGSSDFMQQAATHAESGGTVGPLPDGTVVEVVRASYIDLESFAGLKPIGALGRTDAEIIDAYNAREAGHA